MRITSTTPAYVLSALLLTSFAGCNMDCISGSGKQTTEMRNIDGAFTEVETNGSITLVLKQDSVQSVKVVADDNIQKELEFHLNGDKLSIELDGNFCDSGPITVYLNAKSFKGLDASGAVEVSSDGRINTQDFNLELSGASKITLNLSAAAITTRSSGSSEINLTGQAGKHDIQLSGSSEINALNFVVGEYDIESSGSSKCQINVLNSLKVNSTGSSEIEYRGNPKDVRNDDSGSSSVKKIN